jgi:hypothetical protein
LPPFYLEQPQHSFNEGPFVIAHHKGEAKNALARAVFLNRLGEIRDRSFENQRYRASGLNLVVAAIVLWNTVYLERAVQTLRHAGKDIDENLLPHLSPLGWEHINLTGDYIWQTASKSNRASSGLYECVGKLSVLFFPFRELTPRRVHYPNGPW